MNNQLEGKPKGDVVANLSTNGKPAVMWGLKIRTSSALIAMAMVLACGNVFEMAQNEPLGDVARRLRAESDQEARQRKSVDVYQGHLTFKVIPKFVDAQKKLINGMEVQVRKSSPNAYRYAFTLKCGEWNKEVPGNIKGSVDSQEEKTNSFDLPLPCNWRDASLDQLREAEGLEGPDPKPSKVPGIDDAELARQEKAREVVPANSVSELQRRVDEACKTQSVGELATGPVSSVGDQMVACAKARDEMNSALRVEEEGQSKARAEALNEPIPGGGVTVRLTGTAGLPFSGQCYYSNSAGTVSKSYDDVIPFQLTVENVDTVNCSFISKSDFRHDLKLEIIKNGKILGESDTDAPYGLVSVARDVN